LAGRVVETGEQHEPVDDDKVALVLDDLHLPAAEYGVNQDQSHQHDAAYGTQQLEDGGSGLDRVPVGNNFYVQPQLVQNVHEPQNY